MRYLISYFYKTKTSEFGVGSVSDDYTEKEVGDAQEIIRKVKQNNPVFSELTVIAITNLDWISTPINVKPNVHRLRAEIAHTVWEICMATLVVSVVLSAILLALDGAGVGQFLNQNKDIAFWFVLVVGIVGQSAQAVYLLCDMAAEEKESKK